MTMQSASGGSSEFRVILQGIKLSAEAESRIELAIKRLVLNELAAVDLKGDLQISPIEKFPNLIAMGPGGGHTQGIVATDMSGV